MVLGRPKVYTESRQGIFLNISHSLLEDIDDKSCSKKLSRNELINSILADNLDNKNSLRIANQLSDLKKAIIKLKKNNTDLISKTITEINKQAGRVFDYYDNVEPDELISRAFDVKKSAWLSVKSDHKSIKFEKSLVSAWINIIFGELEYLALLENKVVNNPKVAKLVIKKLLLE